MKVNVEVIRKEIVKTYRGILSVNASDDQAGINKVQESIDLGTIDMNKIKWDDLPISGKESCLETTGQAE